MPDLIDSVYFLAVIISALFSDHVAPKILLVALATNVLLVICDVILQLQVLQSTI